MASAAGREGEVRGTKVTLRECSRLIGVRLAQPLAGAWLQAIPGPTLQSEDTPSLLVWVSSKSPE